jgi:hypothetical protein
MTSGSKSRVLAVAGCLLVVSAIRRGGEQKGYRESGPWRAYDAVAQAVDHRFGWHRLPVPLGLAVLVGVRNILRRENLHDTTGEPSIGEPAAQPFEPSLLSTRTAEGTYNDLDAPTMGRAGSRFGRNIPIDRTWPEPDSGLLEPSPRTVSRELLTRHEFQPATSVNALAASWLQFMIRDWFSHGESPTEDPWRIELSDDDPWPDRPMQVMRTPADPTRAPEASTPPTYVNTLTHWWDGSSIYGTSAEQQSLARSGVEGKLALGPDYLPPVPDDPEHNPAYKPGFWLGLPMLHSLFAREHNAICDHLRGAYPTWSDEEVFQRARLVNAALIAKIHTVEWTPAVISHPTTVVGLRANWWGVLGERIKRAFGRLGRGEVLSGIVGAETEHFGVPYSLTEEFVAVYRMHPLIRDDWSFRALADDRPLEELTFREIAGPGALAVLQRIDMSDLLYSFGTQHPGLVTLHNFPRFLQEFERPDGKLMDLGAVDVLRSRELGVPRYNEFRRLLHLPAPRTFEELTDDPEWADQIRRVYDGDIERVDLLVGMYAEPRPAGFAFSDTAFRIFVLMASRRLNSDRFLTRDYRPEVYTPEGLAWVDGNTMMTVLLRHHPELRPAMRGLANAFWPWTRA